MTNPDDGLWIVALLLGQKIVLCRPGKDWLAPDADIRMVAIASPTLHLKVGDEVAVFDGQATFDEQTICAIKDVER